MAEYLTTTADLTAVADAIRTKGGTAKQLVYPSGFVSAIQAIKTDAVESLEWHQCPELVRNYLANVVYDPADYSTSQIANYAPAEAVVSNYKPIGQEAGVQRTTTKCRTSSRPLPERTRRERSSRWMHCAGFARATTPQKRGMYAIWEVGPAMEAR